jgi:beta-lactamase regulating signal transducer with metallopeptidase domain
MNSFIVYLLESGLCLLVFFTLYQLILKRETYYRLNRAYLLLSLLFSLIVPLLKISLTTGASSQIPGFQMEPLLVTATRDAVEASKQVGIYEILAGLYFLVVLILSLRLIFGFTRIGKLYSSGEVKDHKNYKLILHSLNYPPFSFFKNIFINRKQYTGKDLDEIVEHEIAHVRQLHSIDLAIAEILKILQWFNPMAWYFKNMVTENHEFLADEAVLNRGFSPESYQLSILTQLFGIRSIPAVHNFNQSVTQKRLKMMEKSKSTTAARLKMLIALPMAIMLFYMFACTSSPNELSAQAKPDSDKDSEVYYMVDQPAEPDGGVMAFRKEIATNIRYPESAAKNGVQGKVFVQFIIDEHGKIITAVQDAKAPPPNVKKFPETDEAQETTDIEGVVVVAYYPPEGSEEKHSKADIQLLADEAVRVIVASKLTWKPALKDGKAVKSAWTIPIQFSLQ